MTHSNEAMSSPPPASHSVLPDLVSSPAWQPFPFEVSLSLTISPLLILGAGSLLTSMLIVYSLLPVPPFPHDEDLRTDSETPSVLCLTASQPFPLQDFILIPLQGLGMAIPLAPSLGAFPFSGS